MRIIVTRPEREAKRWATDLCAQGFKALALPLIQIGPVHDQGNLIATGKKLDSYVGVMFVSANAVDHFFACHPALASGLGASGAGSDRGRAWATGPGTVRALLRAGIARGRIDAPPSDAVQFDSEALWQVVGAQVHADDRVLIVRGAAAYEGAELASGSGRDWFAQKVEASGASVEYAVSYQRLVPQLDAAERELALQAANDRSIWLFSSVQAVRNLQAVFPKQPWGQARALATHARIAAEAKSAGFGVVLESRPTLSDVLATLKSADELRRQG
jgi:uroporphyrinogen-III synthase